MPPSWKQPKVWAQVAYYTSLGFILPAGAVAGYMAGWALDRWLHIAPWLSVAAALVGVAAGLIEIIRILLRAEKDASGDNSSDGPGSG